MRGHNLGLRVPTVLSSELRYWPANVRLNRFSQTAAQARTQSVAPRHADGDQVLYEVEAGEEDQRVLENAAASRRRVHGEERRPERAFLEQPILNSDRNHSQRQIDASHSIALTLY